MSANMDAFLMFSAYGMRRDSGFLTHNPLHFFGEELKRNKPE